MSKNESGDDDLGASEIEDDEVIVIEADNHDLVEQDMIQYLERSVNASVEGRGMPVNANADDGEQVCRICLGEEEDAQNDPLFSPCICAGSMGLIHLTCLKEWLKSKKIQRKGEVVSTFFWKNLECELCKQRFPVEIELADKRKFLILDYDLPEYEANDQPHYMTLESISSNTSKVVHVLNLIDDDEITLGRGHDINVRVTDISVSRCHAFIKKCDKGFFYI